MAEEPGASQRQGHGPSDHRARPVGARRKKTSLVLLGRVRSAADQKRMTLRSGPRPTGQMRQNQRAPTAGLAAAGNRGGSLNSALPEKGRDRKNRPYYGAFVSALAVGVLSGVSTFLAAWSTANDAKTVGIAAATCFSRRSLARFGGEGICDTNRDAKITARVIPLKGSDAGLTASQMRTTRVQPSA